MRIVTWNCYRGTISDRLSKLESLEPDFVALQECGQPKDSSPDVLWRGTNPSQGVALIDCRQSRPLTAFDSPQLPATVVAADIAGMNPFVLVNLWAHPSPTYEAFVLDALRAVKESLKPQTQLVVVGDFNSTPARLRGAHDHLMKVMNEELSLISAYHAHHSVPTGDEVHPTHYWRWQQTKPFHIDYVFVPTAWRDRVRSVEVGTFDSWPDSDHRPVVVDIG